LHTPRRIGHIPLPQCTTKSTQPTIDKSTQLVVNESTQPTADRSTQPTTNNAFVQSHHNVGNTEVKQKSSIAHKSLIETTKKANATLVDSINCIHEVNIQIEDK
jgi:hypothetical protein